MSSLCQSLLYLICFFFSLFRADAPTPKPVSREMCRARTIRSGITYYYIPVTEAEFQTVSPAKDSMFPLSSSALPLSDSSSADDSFPPLRSHSPSQTPVTLQNQSDSASASRPLLVFFAWLGAQPKAVVKYRDLYLDRGMDVLLVQSSVMHFLWPRWGMDYGQEVMNVLQQPQFSGRTLLVHASSIGGYTFTQILNHIAQEPKTNSALGQRVIGHIYDSLVVGTLENMAIGEQSQCGSSCFCAGYVCQIFK